MLWLFFFSFYGNSSEIISMWRYWNWKSCVTCVHYLNHSLLPLFIFFRSFPIHHSCNTHSSFYSSYLPFIPQSLFSFVLHLIHLDHLSHHSFNFSFIIHPSFTLSLIHLLFIHSFTSFFFHLLIHLSVIPSFMFCCVFYSLFLSLTYSLLPSYGQQVTKFN